MLRYKKHHVKEVGSIPAQFVTIKLQHKVILKPIKDQFIKVSSILAQIKV